MNWGALLDIIGWMVAVGILAAVATAIVYVVAGKWGRDD